MQVVWLYLYIEEAEPGFRVGIEPEGDWRLERVSGQTGFVYEWQKGGAAQQELLAQGELLAWATKESIQPEHQSLSTFPLVFQRGAEQCSR